MAETFREYCNIPSRTKQFYMLDQFEVSAICNSRHNSSDENLLSRFRNTLVTAINEKVRLPKYILIVLDDDLLKFLDYYNVGSAGMYGDWLQYLVEEIHEIFKKGKQQLPKKAVKSDFPFIYWVAAPCHQYFDYNDQRAKHNLCLESICKTNNDMRIIKFKDHWDHKNNNLVVSNRLLPSGKTAYWKAIDASLKFNIFKRDSFLHMQ